MNFQKYAPHRFVDSFVSRGGQTSTEERTEKILISLQRKIDDKRWDIRRSEGEMMDNMSRLSSLILSLKKLSPTKNRNRLVGKCLTTRSALGRSLTSKSDPLKFLLGRSNYARAIKEDREILVLNTGSTSTKLALFKGISKKVEADICVSAIEDDSIERRSVSILKWFDDNGFSFDTIDGIASRGGFISPVPTGTYLVTPEMVKDLQSAKVDHASNMSIPIALSLVKSRMGGRSVPLTTTDPVVCDEIDIVDRLTGFIKIKRDGSGVHYLNHKAVAKYVCALEERDPEQASIITAHLGGGISVARHCRGKITSILDAYSGIPSTNRAGYLDMSKVLAALRMDEIDVEELESAVFYKGGLLSLTGTNSFKTLIDFYNQEATGRQREKIQLILDFYARQIASSIFKIGADGYPVDRVVLTGGLSQSRELISKIESNIDFVCPVVVIPGSIEHESLAAGLLNGMFQADSLLDYQTERDQLAKRIKQENELIDTVIFEKKAKKPNENTPISSLKQLIDRVRLNEGGEFVPTIGIIGADNKNALLAAKMINEGREHHVAKFSLIGNSAKINEVARACGWKIASDIAQIVDTEDPVTKAMDLFDNERIHVLMKGEIKTETLLPGVLRYMKATGKMRKEELASQVCAMDIPTRNGLLLFSDAAINTYPDMNKKIKILKNALKVARSLRFNRPRVAVVSAIESVNKSVKSSIEAEEIARYFNERDDVIVEGPLSFDVAVSPEVALRKGYNGKIRGDADILILPDIDAANVLYKSLTTQSKAVCAAVVLCGNNPVVLTSRTDSVRSKLASISLAISLLRDLK